MCVWIVFIADIAKEVDLVSRCEQGGGDTVHGGVSPSLLRGRSIVGTNIKMKGSLWEENPPHNKTLPVCPSTQRMLGMLHLSRIPYLRFRNYSRLEKKKIT